MPAVGTAVAGFLGLAGTLGGAIVATGVNLGLSFGLSYLSQALSPQPTGPRAGGFSAELKIGGAVPRSFIYGRYATGGSLIYVNTWGSSDGIPNAFLTQVIAVSDLPVGGLAGLIVDGVAVTYDPEAAFENNLGIPIPEYSKGGRNHLWVRFHDGNQTTADDYLVSKYSDRTVRPWKDTAVASGMAYVVITSRAANNNLFTGIPTIKPIVDGVALYDLRNDDTAGGEGDERWNDPSTWSYGVSNPAIILYNIWRGLSYGGKWFYGLQTVDAAQMPFSSWVAAANECDLTVTNADATTSKQFYIGGEVQVSTEPLDEAGLILMGCNGQIADAFGTYKMHVGAAGAAVVTISDEDLLSTEEQRFIAFPSLDEAVNGVTATFVSPDDAWEIKDLPPRLSAAYEAEDGGRRALANVQYTRVTSGQQAQRLMLSALQEARRHRKHVLVVGPAFFKLEPLDFIGINSASNGYVNKLFRVDVVEETQKRDQTLYITEVDPADYDYDAGTDELPLPPSDSQPIIVPPQTVQDFGFAGVAIPGDVGYTPGLRFTWNIPDEGAGDIDAVQFEVRLASDHSSVLQTQTTFVESPPFVTNQNVRGATVYEGRAKFSSSSGRDFAWSSWLTATTPQGTVSRSDFDASLDAIIAQVLKASTRDLPSIRSQLNTLAGAIATQVTTLRENLGQALSSVGARVDDNIALSELAQSAAATATSALSSLFGDVLASTGVGTAESLMRFTSSSAPDGVVASIALEARVTVQDTFYPAGIYIDVGVTDLGGGSRIRLSANEIIFSDPQGVMAPFDALLLTVGDGITSVPIVAGTPNTVTPDLSDRRQIYATLATAGFTLKFPAGARIGRGWKHEVTQDATGGRAVAIGTGYINPAGGSIDTRATYTTLIDGYIRSLSPQIAVLTGFQAVGYNIQDWAYAGHYTVADRGFRPVTDASGAADDLMVVFTMWTSQIQQFQIYPSNTLPAGWTLAHQRLGSTRTVNPQNANYIYHYAYVTAAFRRLDGTETAKVNFLSSVSGVSGYRTEVYRFTGGLTPQVIQKKDAYGYGSNPSIILNLSAEQSRLIAFTAGAAFQTFGTGPTLTASPSLDQTDGSLLNPVGWKVGYKIRNSAPADETISFQNKGDATTVIGFALKV